MIRISSAVESGSKLQDNYIKLEENNQLERTYKKQALRIKQTTELINKLINLSKLKFC